MTFGSAYTFIIVPEVAINSLALIPYMHLTKQVRSMLQKCDLATTTTTAASSRGIIGSQKHEYPPKESIKRDLNVTM